MIAARRRLPLIFALLIFCLAAAPALAVPPATPVDPRQRQVAPPTGDSSEPIDPNGTPFYQFQLDWINDTSRLQIADKGRQVGLSWATCAKAAFHILDPDKKGDWVFLSASERQSKKLARTFVEWVKAIDKTRAALLFAESGLPWSEKEEWCPSIAEKVTVLEVTFANDKVATFLPANPDTARGWAANVALDEFAFHKDGFEILKGVGPAIARGYCMLILSTANGKQGAFYEIYSAAVRGENKYSALFVPTSLAIEQGAEIDYQVLCDLLNNDPDAIAQELEGAFLDTAAQFISPELLAFAETDKAPEPARYEGWKGTADDRQGRLLAELKPSPTRIAGDLFADDFEEIKATIAQLRGRGRLFFGFDVGRTRDLTVLTIGAEIDSEFLKSTIPVATIELAGVSFDSQWAVVELALEICVRGCFDARGIGAQLAETAARHYGAKAEGIMPTNAINEEMAMRVLRKLRDTTAKLPVSNAIRASFRSIRKTKTATGHDRFDAVRTAEGGHGDHFWSYALMLAAGDRPTGKFAYHSVVTRRLGAFFQGREAKRDEINSGARRQATRRKGGGRRGSA